MRNDLMLVFFVAGLLARGLFLTPIFHWQVVLMDWVFFDEIGRNNWLSVSVVLLVLGACSCGVRLALAQPLTRERMKFGAQPVSQWRAVVFSIGATSVVGGGLLLQTGNALASWLAVGLGLATLLLESVAALGSRLSEPFAAADIPVPSEPMRVPIWVPIFLFSWMGIVFPTSWYLIGGS